MIFGWGKRSQAWVIGEGNRRIVAQWSYFSLFFCPFAFGITWHLLEDSRSADKMITYEEVKKLFPKNPPKISFWYRYGLLIGIAVILLIGYLNS